MRSEALVVGAGPCGSLLAVLLGRAGWSVRLVEKRGNPRSDAPGDGRAIHLAVSGRARSILADSGLEEAFAGIAAPVRARVVHRPGGGLHVQPYGERAPGRGADRILVPGEPLHAVDRGALAAILAEAADRTPDVEVLYGHEVVGVDPDEPAVLAVGPDGAEALLEAGVVVGADGAFSRVRGAMVESGAVEARVTSPPIEYRQLSMRRGSGQAALRPDAHHLWARSGAVLTALPRTDGSFAAALFLPSAGEGSFGALAGEGDLEGFFHEAFPDAAPLAPDLSSELRGNAVGRFATVRCRPWSAGRMVLAGDACHALVPFSGQGANAALEDAVTLAGALASGVDPERALEAWEGRRRAETEVVSDLSDVLGPFVLWLAGAVG